MSFGKKVVVAVNLNESSVEDIKVVRRLDFFKDAQVHLVYVYQTTVMGYGFGFVDTTMIYPLEDDRKVIEQSALAALAKMAHDILPGHSESNSIQRCLFSESPKVALTEYAEKIKADTIVVCTREKHGLFDSSFAQYVAKHSKSNVIIMKP